MSANLIPILWDATLQTLYMVAVSAILGTLGGLPLGVFLACSQRGELLSAPWINKVLGLVVNATRSVPFIILVVAIIPFTRAIVGTSIGTNAAIVPLTLAAIPFIARLVENAIREVDAGLIEAARAMGATPLQIIRKVLIPEALPGITLGLTLAVVSLIGYSAMVGAVGGQGLGDLGIRYGYQRFMPEVMAAVVVILIVMVQLVQSIGEWIAARVDRRAPAIAAPEFFRRQERTNPMLRLTTLVSALALSSAAMAQDITVGVTPGEHGEIMEKVAEVAAPLGLNIRVIEFSDYVVPNQALADGDLDANSFQHRPYLENQMNDRGFALVEAGTTITTPMGVYSARVDDLADLPEGAQVAIPNDPTNGGRALLILQDLGLVTLTEGTGLVPSPLDIAENPRGLRFLELDAAQLPRALEDADAAVINTNFALAAGLSPREDSIAMEKADSPYVNIIVVQQDRAEEPWVQTLVEAYQSPEVKAFIDETYEGAVITSW